MPQLTSLSLAGTTHMRTPTRAHMRARARIHTRARTHAHKIYQLTMPPSARACAAHPLERLLRTARERRADARRRAVFISGPPPPGSRFWGGVHSRRRGSAAGLRREGWAHGERCAAMRRELSPRRGRGGAFAGAPHDVAADVAQPRRHDRACTVPHRLSSLSRVIAAKCSASDADPAPRPFPAADGSRGKAIVPQSYRGRSLTADGLQALHCKP